MKIGAPWETKYGCIWALTATFAFRLLAILLFVGSGCSREYYRCQADKDVYRILASRMDDPRWRLPRTDISPDPRSRFYDPSDPDCPPLPPDDPTAYRLMKRPYGMRSWSGWWELPHADTVENPSWPTFFGGSPLGAADGQPPKIEKLDLATAIEIGLIQSREYQEQLEEVYLSALALTYERYRFDVRPLGFDGEPGFGLFFQHQPDDKSNLQFESGYLGLSKLLPTGAQFVAELANNTIWLFSGPNETRTATTFAYSLVQPLLAGGGRQIVLERLTQAERNVLYTIRRFARFRKDFYVMVVTGRRAAPLPGSPSRAELAFLIRGERSPTVGFNTLLFLLQMARNQAENVRSLERRLRDMEALHRAGRATLLDVTQVRSSLQTARHRYLWRQRMFEDELDRFKMQLGLPPDMEIELDTTLLENFQFRSEQVAEVEDQLRALDEQLSALQQQPVPALAVELSQKMTEACSQLAAAFEQTQQELDRMYVVHKVRLKQVDPETQQEIQELDRQYPQRLEALRTQYQGCGNRLASLVSSIQQGTIPPQNAAGQLVQMRDLLAQIARRLGAFVTAVRAELVVLPPVDPQLTPERAVQLALENRLDLMNRRALVMDARRRLELAADQLQGTLDIVAEGEVNTPPLLDNNNPTKFDADESSFRVGVNVVTPLDRVRQRNNFRAAQIAYQRARRNYMAAEDQVKLDVRHALRRVRQEAANFELQRRTLRVAAEELLYAIEAADHEVDDQTAALHQGLSVSRALENVRLAQDSLIESWMDYERARLELFRDMGTMTIDEHGMWPVEEQRRWSGLEQLDPETAQAVKVLGW